ncbi:MAG: NPCBM/NEW2 domain-containing protein [Pirellulales bacterium]|nr:NPCBM/NEW2 domain-containing protein [Pirellulales bacterium]
MISPAFCEDQPNPPKSGEPTNGVWLETLDLGTIVQDWGKPQAIVSVENHPLKIGGQAFEHGVGTHANSQWRIDLKGAATTFLALMGVDDDTEGKGIVKFEVWVDGKLAAESGLMKGGDKAKQIQADLTGAKEMVLLVTDADGNINFDHADWAAGFIVLQPGGAKPESVKFPEPPPPVLARDDSPLPAIHGPRIVGSTPGRPFLFLIPATGEPALIYAAKNLPEGLKLDPYTGIISGSLKQEGTSDVELEVRNARGKTRRKLTIVGGKHKLALTPPMGWNSWNCWAGAVSDDKVRAAADAMVRSGLAAHGYQFINIDDCWEGKRDQNGEILTNQKFPDMKELADYVHSQGLKLGIYSSPGPKTCAGFEGSYKHEKQDAKTWAKWGIDYLKYDWCSYGEIAPNPDRAAAMKPYQLMRQALDECDRDIVYSLCQYGMQNVWEWGAEVGGNLWRTTGDIGDSWGSMAGIGFRQNVMAPYAKPGHWNDPDMLVVGKVGWGPQLHPTNLTRHEQVTHITLWSLLAAPLLIGCDMAALDDFTLTLLTNPEVIDVDQDPLGKAAVPVKRDGPKEIWARPLFDGALAVGLFNRGSLPTTVRADWKDLKLEGPQAVRDLWQRKDLGNHSQGFEIVVQPHGAVLLKVGTPRENGK